MPLVFLKCHCSVCKFSVHSEEENIDHAKHKDINFFPRPISQFTGSINFYDKCILGLRNCFVFHSFKVKVLILLFLI